MYCMAAALTESEGVVSVATEKCPRLPSFFSGVLPWTFSIALLMIDTIPILSQYSILEGKCNTKNRFYVTNRITSIGLEVLEDYVVFFVASDASADLFNRRCVLTCSNLVLLFSLFLLLGVRLEVAGVPSFTLFVVPGFTSVLWGWGLGVATGLCGVFDGMLAILVLSFEGFYLFYNSNIPTIFRNANLQPKNI